VIILFVELVRRWRIHPEETYPGFERGKLERAGQGELYFHSGHSWALTQSPDLVNVGVDDFAARFIGRIESVEITNRKFKPISKEKFESKFLTSLNVWLGDKTYKIKLLLMKPWYTRRKLPLLVENQTITKNPDGSMILEAEVSSIVEVSHWIVAQGRGIKILEPKELLKLVLELARGAVENVKDKV